MAVTTERIWITYLRQGHKLAFCGVYMRTNSSRDSDFFKDNELLLHTLTKEKDALEIDGYEVCFMGDFNA